jgi:hypothetical protein
MQSNIGFWVHAIYEVYKWTYCHSNSVCVCLSVIERIELPFGMRVTPSIVTLYQMGVRIPPIVWGNRGGGSFAPNGLYASHSQQQHVRIGQGPD